MSMKRYYSCDLCGSSILDDSGGIAIYHGFRGEIKAESLIKEGCGHHLCNSCIKGLKGMLPHLSTTVVEE